MTKYVNTDAYNYINKIPVSVNQGESVMSRETAILHEICRKI